jgi:hypothetical protein
MYYKNEHLLFDDTNEGKSLIREQLYKGVYPWLNENGLVRIPGHDNDIESDIRCLVGIPDMVIYSVLTL